MAISPADVMPDQTNEVMINDVSIRKGSMAALLANAEILADTQASESEKSAALEMIKTLLPALMASGMHRHIRWVNPRIQTLADELLELNSRTGH